MRACITTIQMKIDDPEEIDKAKKRLTAMREKRCPGEHRACPLRAQEVDDEPGYVLGQPFEKRKPDLSFPGERRWLT